MNDIFQTDLNKATLHFFRLSIAVTILSQIAEIESITRPIMYGCWLALLIDIVFLNRGRLYLTVWEKMFISFSILFLIFCFICSILGHKHLQSQYFRILWIPLLVTLIGNLLYQQFDLNMMVNLCRVYVIFSILFAAWINLTYFSSYQVWISSNIYVFSQKNSAAQIWGTSILLVYYILLPRCRNLFSKGLYVIALVYLFLLIALSQCRTALLGIGCIIFYNIVKSKHKIVWTILIITLTVCIMRYSPTRNFVNQVFLLEKYKNADLNTMSSGRLALWKQAVEIFIDSPLIGVGTYYVDCSYLAILAANGLIGFFIIETVWISRVILNFRYNSKTDFGRKHFFASITIFYLVESLLEGFPPFGPGTCSFMFWLISSWADTRRGSLTVPDIERF